MSIDDKEAENDCGPVVRNKDIDPNLLSWESKIKLNPDKIASPCGIVAKSIFNDTFSLITDDGVPIEIDESNLSFEGDAKKKYKK